MRFLNTLGMIAMAYALFLIGPELEGYLFPVLKNMKVESRVIEDNNVVLYVHVDKVRSCQYIAPWRARTISGRMLQVVHEEVDGPNWAKGNVHSKIKILGAGTEVFTLTAEHECHPGWTVFSYLGEIK